MFQLLMTRKPASVAVREFAGRMFTRMSDTVAEFRNSKVTKAVEPAADPADVYTAAELPAVEDIDAAATLYFRAADQARTADRAKRAAKKVLDRLPAGRHGSWDITREPSGRETVDLEAVRKLFKQHGLGPVPMKTSAPSLKVHKADLTSVAQQDTQAEISKVVTTLEPAPAEPTSGACARCTRTWDLSDLSPDGNGDQVCCDCHASDPGDDRAEYRSYAHAGR